MSDEKIMCEIYSKILAFLLLPFILILSIYIDGCVLLQYWKWFGESIFGTNLSMVIVCGLSSMISFIRCNAIVLKKEPEIAPFQTLFKLLIVIPLFYYVVGYCIHTYM